MSSQIFALACVTTITILLLIVIVHLLNRRFIGIKDELNKESTTYGIWYAGTIISAGLIFWQSITVSKETIENVYQQSLIIQNTKAELPFWIAMKSAILLLGVSALWFILWYYITIASTKLIVGNKDDREEMLAFNTNYFLVRAGLQISFSLIFLPFLLFILRGFLPQTSVTFYH